MPMSIWASSVVIAVAAVLAAINESATKPVEKHQIGIIAILAGGFLAIAMPLWEIASRLPLPPK